MGTVWDDDTWDPDAWDLDAWADALEAAPPGGGHGEGGGVAGFGQLGLGL